LLLVACRHNAIRRILQTDGVISPSSITADLSTQRKKENEQAYDSCMRSGVFRKRKNDPDAFHVHDAGRNVR
jgi:hypothetical protein